LWKSAAEAAESVRAFALLDEAFLSPDAMAINTFEERDAILSPALRAARGAGRRPADFLADDVPADLERAGDWMLRIEQRAYLSYVLLRDIDAMSMAHSLEVRVPFLDPDYGAALARIPWQMKYRDGVGKWVLKQALRPLLPDDVLFRPKMGFGLPYQIWMRRSLEPIIRDLLSPARVARRGIFDVDETARLVDRFYRGDDSVWRRVWTAFALEGWASEVVDALEVRNADAA
jgi:asparagine synthase (glutamine-hydrolysing)